MKAGYRVEVAREFGIPAAVLLDKIAFLQRYTKRPDGFVFKTSAEIENETGLSRYQQERAIERLKAAGLIECKVTKTGKRSAPVRHFRLTEAGEIASHEMRKTDISEMRKTDISRCGKLAFPINNIINNNINARANAGPAGGRSAARGKEEQREREQALEEEWAQEFAERKKAAGGAFTVFDGGKR